ncbi:hypothetical protein [Alkalibacillus salilacus]|uniref:DUF3188 domain-containing protein n=1 Tax=Alkalibacillus salilacus TaxID=284582 RepID=A0ABT9VI60_9BACI|nr:hypothetical protein [Alkalibacillus salilacus]MDQ0160658.1 hypothetical protein [Alkalibacillus salilacus]
MDNAYLPLTMLGLMLVMIALGFLDGVGLIQYLVAGAGVVLSAVGTFKLLRHERKEKET